MVGMFVSCARRSEGEGEGGEALDFFPGGKKTLACQDSSSGWLDSYSALPPNHALLATHCEWRKKTHQEQTRKSAPLPLQSTLFLLVVPIPALLYTELADKVRQKEEINYSERESAGNRESEAAGFFSCVVVVAAHSHTHTHWSG